MCDVHITAYVDRDVTTHVQSLALSICRGTKAMAVDRPDEWHDAGAEGDELIHLTYDEQCFFFSSIR